ncbi:unnamed protein product, partial [marine sediment metagenome]
NMKRVDWNKAPAIHQKFVDLNGKTEQQELIAAVTGKQIQVSLIMAGAASETTYLLQSADNSIFPLLMSAGGGLVKISAAGSLFATNEGEALNVTLSEDPGANSGIYLQYKYV